LLSPEFERFEPVHFQGEKRKMFLTTKKPPGY